MSEKPVMEIAIRRVKADMDEQFVAARSAFIAKLKEQPGVEKDWEFKSFFTMPGEDDTDVFVGMTRYASAETASGIAGKLMNTELAGNFFATFDMKAFVLVQPADGGDFVLEDYINAPGQVLEVAVRVPTVSEEEFQAGRDAFFGVVAQQPGYIMDREFIDLQSGAKVVLIAWESLEHFQAALGVLQTREEMGRFFGMIKAKAYQAIQPVS